MADPTGKATRVARSRLACTGCRQTKQRCDGPSVNPCRRCQLYGLECEYEPSTGPVAKAAARIHAPAPAYTAPPVAPISATHTDALVSTSLREIADRLRSIELSLDVAHLAFPTINRDDEGTSPCSLRSLPHRQSSDDSGASSTKSLPSGPDVDAGHLSGAKSNNNPLETVISQLSMIEPGVGEKSLPFASWGMSSEDDGPSENLSRAFAGLSMDAITRGILTSEECDASFEIFFKKLTPWVLFFDDVRDRSASSVRERSSLLFHTILLSTSYYLMESSPRGAQVYYALTSLVNELISPLIVSPQPHQINSDFIRALCLLILYKPVQFAQMYNNGITNPAAVEQACKLNNFSSSILSGLMTRTALAIHLSASPNTFSKAFLPTSGVAPTILSDTRLWYWICIVDAQGSLSMGRAPQLDMAEALRTTRLFASLKQQVGDVRLAATVELYAVAASAANTIWLSGPRSINPRDLKRLNQEVNDWESYWSELLQSASQNGDQLAHLTANLFANFIRLVINTNVFSRWRADRQESRSRGGNGHPDLSSEDWQFLEIGLAAAEKLVFSLSTESRIDGNPFQRRLNWPTSEAPRAPLNLDPVMVDMHKTAFDNITCVVYVYSLITVAKMANAGLIRCELTCTQDEYAAGRAGTIPQRLRGEAKLARLLQLGASFLDAIAPTRSHPAKKHARMLRAIHAAGTSGNSAPVNPTGIHNNSSIYAADSSTNAARDVEVAPRELGDREPSPGLSIGSGASGSTSPSQPPSSFALPPLSNPSAKLEEPGEVLAAVLGGLSPSWLGQFAYLESFQDLGNGFDNGMVVDWDSLEKSMNLHRAEAPPFVPLENYFNLAH